MIMAKKVTLNQLDRKTLHLLTPLTVLSGRQSVTWDATYAVAGILNNSQRHVSGRIDLCLDHIQKCREREQISLSEQQGWIEPRIQ